MKNIEKYVKPICVMIAQSNECYFGADCDKCELNGFCCNVDELMHYMLKPANSYENDILMEPHGTE